ncbi:DUF4352 domain-containing protein [Actinomadura fulvescens]
MQRRAVAVLLVLLSWTGSTSCSGGEEPERKTTYEVPPRPVRDGETAVRGRTGHSGDQEFRIIGFRAGIPEIVGSHADIKPKGTFVRVRLITENRGRTTQFMTTGKQLLVTADGRTHPVDVNAMMVKRQPEELAVGAGVRIEFDLWYDVPPGVKVNGIRLFGSPSPGAVSDPPPANIPLP